MLTKIFVLHGLTPLLLNQEKNWQICCDMNITSVYKSALRAPAFREVMKAGMSQSRMY